MNIKAKSLFSFWTKSSFVWIKSFDMMLHHLPRLGPTWDNWLWVIQNKQNINVLLNDIRKSSTLFKRSHKIRFLKKVSKTFFLKWNFSLYFVYPKLSLYWQNKKKFLKSLTFNIERDLIGDHRVVNKWIPHMTG